MPRLHVLISGGPTSGKGRTEWCNSDSCLESEVRIHLNWFWGCFLSDSKSLAKNTGHNQNQGVQLLYICHDFVIYVICWCFFYRSFTNFPQIPSWISELGPRLWGWGTSVCLTAQHLARATICRTKDYHSRSIRRQWSRWLKRWSP